MKSYRFIISLTLSIASLIPHITHAGVVFHTSLTSLDSVTSTVVVEDFESFSPLDTPLTAFLTSDGITYSPHDGFPDDNLRVSSAGQTNFGVLATTSNVLRSRGNENILMTFNSPILAIGFDTYLNQFSGAEITVYGSGGAILDTFNQFHSPSSVGFLGITSDSDITAVRFVTEFGSVVNTGIDNIRLATAIVLEPAPYLLFFLGSLLIFLKRRPLKG